MGGWDQVATQVAGQLAYLPGVLVVGAFTVSVAGLLPRRSMLAWILVAGVFFQTMLGGTRRLPGVPDEPFDPVPGLVELLLAVALVLLGCGATAATTWSCTMPDPLERAQMLASGPSASPNDPASHPCAGRPDRRSVVSA